AGLLYLPLQGLQVELREQRLAQRRARARGDQRPLRGVTQVERGVPDAELLPQLVGLARDYGVQQDAGTTQRLEQGVEHRVQAGGVSFVAGQLPRLDVRYVLVRLANGLHHGSDGPLELQRVEEAGHLGRQVGERLPQLHVRRLHRTGGRHDSVSVALEHAQGAVQQVAEVVGQVRVDALGDRHLGEAGVESERHVPDQEVPERIVAITPDHLERPDDVAERLAHLALVVEPVAVHVEVLVERYARRLQHYRPEQAVRLEDVLADEVRRYRPVALDRVPGAQHGVVGAARV